MGWREGTGLGRNWKEGAEPAQPKDLKRRPARLGLGASAAPVPTHKRHIKPGETRAAAAEGPVDNKGAAHIPLAERNPAELGAGEVRGRGAKGGAQRMRRGTPAAWWRVAPEALKLSVRHGCLVQAPVSACAPPDHQPCQHTGCVGGRWDPLWSGLHLCRAGGQARGALR